MERLDISFYLSSKLVLVIFLDPTTYLLLLKGVFIGFDPSIFRHLLLRFGRYIFSRIFILFFHWNIIVQLFFIHFIKKFQIFYATTYMIVCFLDIVDNLTSFWFRNNKNFFLKKWDDSIWFNLPWNIIYKNKSFIFEEML